MKNLIILFSVLVLLAAAGCSVLPAPSRSDGKLVFVVQLSMDPDGQTRFRIGARNVGSQALPENKNFDGVMEIQGEQGKLRSRIDMHQFPHLAPGQEELPGGLLAKLEPGSYKLLLTAPGQQTLEVPFAIVQKDGHAYLRAAFQYINPMTPFTLADQAAAPVSREQQEPMDVRVVDAIPVPSTGMNFRQLLPVDAEIRDQVNVDLDGDG